MKVLLWAKTYDFKRNYFFSLEIYKVVASKAIDQKDVQQEKNKQVELSKACQIQVHYMVCENGVIFALLQILKDIQTHQRGTFLDIF